MDDGDLGGDRGGRAVRPTRADGWLDGWTRDDDDGARDARDASRAATVAETGDAASRARRESDGSSETRATLV